MLFLQQKGEFVEHFLELKTTKIFKDANEFECQAMMFCFKTRFKTFDKNEIIVSQGDELEYVILILKGAAIAQNIDSLGEISILSQLKCGDTYGVESAFAGEKFYKDNLIATEKSLVLFLNTHRLLNPCPNKCKRHDFVLKNLMQTVAESSMKLLDKLYHMSKKSTREKLMSYFISMSKKSNSTYFEIPFNKTELANYLSVDRSAMSTELSKMKAEGLIDFDKKQYHIIKKEL